jgi:predicted RNA-binding Zn ribbon-like protein
MSPISHEFALLGEPLAVELVNTRPMRDGTHRELLVDDAAAAAWLGLHAGELPAGHDQAPPTATRLRAMRDAVEALFDAALESRTPVAEAIAHVNEVSAASPLQLELQWREGAPARAVTVVPEPVAPEMSLAAIARSAIEILGDPRGSRLRRCEAPDCVLLFVATNARRRWCSTTACGNRTRVARHYARTRSASLD